MKTSKKLLNLFVALFIYVVTLPIVFLEMTVGAVLKTYYALLDMLPEGVGKEMDKFTR